MFKRRSAHCADAASDDILQNDVSINELLLCAGRSGFPGDFRNDDSRRVQSRKPLLCWNDLLCIEEYRNVGRGESGSLRFKLLDPVLSRAELEAEVLRNDLFNAKDRR